MNPDLFSDQEARIVVWSLRTCGVACWIVALVLLAQELI
jgi:hypothetical protein